MAEACTALATKLELGTLSKEVSQLEGELSSKLDESEKGVIVKTASAAGAALAIGTLDPRITGLLDELTAIGKQVKALGGKLLGLIDKIGSVFSILATFATIAQLVFLTAEVQRLSGEVAKANKMANNAYARSDIAIGESNKAVQEANKAVQTANTATQRATEASNQANAAVVTANRAIGDAAVASRDAREARTEANRATTKANLATAKADAATIEAQAATNRANEAIDKANAIEAENAQLRSEVEQLKSVNVQQQAQILANTGGIAAAKGAASAAAAAALKKADKTEVDEQGRIVRQVREKTVTNFGEITGLKSAAVGLESSLDREIREGRKRANDVIERVKNIVSSNLGTFEKTLTKTRTGGGSAGLTETQVKDIVKTETTTQVKELEKVNDKQYNDIMKGLAGLGLGLAGLTTTDYTSQFTNLSRDVGTIKDQTRPQALTQAASTAVCNSTQPGGCMNSNILQPIQKNFGNLINATGTAFSAMNNIMLSGMKNTLNTIKTTTDVIKTTTTNTFNLVNHAQHGLEAIQNFASTAWRVTRADKIMTGVSLALTLHNAMMLSNNVLQTVSEATEMSLNALGIRDETDEPIDIGGAIKEKISALLTKLLGETAYAELTAKIVKANRIYQSSINLLDTVHSLYDSARTVAELTAENTGKIGNALRESGAVYEDAYEEFMERVSPQNAAMRRLEGFREGLESVENVFDTVSQISSSVVETQDNWQQLKTEKEAWKTEVETAIQEEITLKEEEKTAAQTTADITDGDFDASPTTDTTTP